MAHSCSRCSWTEVDSRSKTEDTSGGAYKYLLMIKFRGTKVLQGAAAGCSFFRNALVDSGIEGENAEDWTYEIRFYPAGEESDYDIFHGSESWVCVDERRKEGKTYGVMAEPNDPAARYIRSRPLNLDPASDSSMLWISGRIAECDNSHVTCAPRRTKLKPARLLQIIADGTALKLRLCSATGEEPYSAVSYCWGVVQQTMLTSFVRETWSSDSGLSISELPASLVDALVVSRKIGLNFVWIDSLCIIQSDDQDKATEISKMAAIYEGAVITISAGSAKRCTDGFLHHLIRPNEEAGASFRLPYACQDGRLGSIILSTDDSWWLGDPIDRRAWTMQEHILSRRVIRFSVLGLQWSCCTMTRFCPSVDTDKMSRRHQDLTELHSLSKIVQHNSDHSLSLWTNILDEFSHWRFLTENEDQLPALAGIASRWGELSNDTYLAGIWLSHLPGGLLWSNSNPSRPRPKSYSAPSWSWASLEGANIDNFSQHLPADEAFRLLSHQIELEFLDLPYGKVKDGSITIRGKVIPMLWSPEEDSLRAPDMDHGYLNPEFVEVSLDVSEDVNEAHECGQQDFEVWLLQLVLFDEDSRTGPAGLVLNKDESNKCRRLGTYSYDHQRGFTTFVDEPGSHGKDWRFYEEMIKQQREKLPQIEPTILTIL